jgi:hypothetical protein
LNIRVRLAIQITQRTKTVPAPKNPVASDKPPVRRGIGVAKASIYQANLHRILAEVAMFYRKINLEIIVPADEAYGVITELNTSLDRRGSVSPYSNDLEVAARTHFA